MARRESSRLETAGRSRSACRQRGRFRGGPGLVSTSPPSSSSRRAQPDQGQGTASAVTTTSKRRLRPCCKSTSQAGGGREAPRSSASRERSSAGLCAESTWMGPVRMPEPRA
eukprot:9405037-Lingulodinium_polyedra.AAC.1